MNGAGDEVQLGDNVFDSFDSVGEVDSGFVQGSGSFNVTNNGAYGGNTLGNAAKRDTSYGGTNGTLNGAGDDVQIGDNISNNFTNVGELNGGFAQGSGTFIIGNNGAFGGNNLTRRDTMSYGGTGGTANGAGDDFQLGDSITNSFTNVGAINSGFAQGSGNFSIVNNGAYGGNNLTRRDTTSYGGMGGTANGAGDEFHFGDNITNSFNNVSAVNSGFAQGSGTFNVINNGAYGGNTLNGTATKRATNSTSYGGTGGTANGAGDEFQFGDNIANSFKNVSEVNGGFAQGSGTFNISNNGAFGGNAESS